MVLIGGKRVLASGIVMQQGAGIIEIETEFGKVSINIAAETPTIGGSLNNIQADVIPTNTPKAGSVGEGGTKVQVLRHVEPLPHNIFRVSYTVILETV
jgi:hypothetical protein